MSNFIKIKCQNQRPEEGKKKKTNCLTAANTSDSNCMKKGFLNYLTYVNRKGLKVMPTNTNITFWRKERTARMFAIVASNTETLESR